MLTDESNTAAETTSAPTTSDAPVESDVDPILTNDMDDVKPNEPLLPKNDYPMEIVKVEQKRTEGGNPRKDGTVTQPMNYLNIQLKTLEAVTSVSGEPIPAGKTFFGKLWLTATEKLTQESIKRELKRFMLCFGVTSGQIAPLTQWPGKRGMVKLGITKPTDDYPEVKNEVKQFVAPK